MATKSKTISEELKSNRKWDLDIIRIIASVAVILVHVSADNWNNVSRSSFEWAVYNAYDGIPKGLVCVFFMVSGALMLSKDKPVSQLWRKNILRIAVVLAFWSFLYALYNYFNGYTLKETFVSFMKGSASHLWFLFAIIGLYAVTPLLKAIVEDRKRARYFLILAFILVFFIPQASSVISVFSNSAGSSIKSWFDSFNIRIAGGYVSYYVLGYYLYTYDIQAKKEKLIYILGLASLIITPLGNWMLAVKFDTSSEQFFGIFTVNVLMKCMALFLFIKNRYKNKELEEKSKKIISRLSKYSFGSYLIHVFVIYFLRYVMGGSVVAYHPAVMIPVFTVIITIISYMLSAILNRLPLIKNLV